MKSLQALIKRLLSIRIVRYGLVGGIGIPINDLALLLFTLLLSRALSLPPDSFWLYAIASACAFEFSNIINFVLNQVFTYREQIKHIHGWEWVRRAAKGQLTSLSAMLLAYAVGVLLVGVFHVKGYLANPAGIIVQFVYNFFISNKLVFRAITPAAHSETAKVEHPSGPMQRIEATPKG